MKSILIFTIVLLASIASNEALQCYTHSICSINCPELKDTVQTCSGDNNKCYKVAFPGGVSRGCGKDRCSVMVDANSVFANVCCEKDLCNAALTWKLSVALLFITAIGHFLFLRI